MSWADRGPEERMNAERVAEILKAHRPDVDGRCVCGRPWPCETYELASLAAQAERYRTALEHIRCGGCGGSPASDPRWEWAYGDAYRNGHVIHAGSVPDLCGPVDFIPRAAAALETGAQG